MSLAHSPLARRILDLLLTDPEKQWSYDEICLLLGSANKTVSSRCMDLLRSDKVIRVMVPSGRPRGRCALVSIKPQLPNFPTWLLPPSSAATAILSQTVQSHKQEAFERRRKVLR
jgi:hypothetical protein